MRVLVLFVFVTFLSSCGMPTGIPYSDIAIGAGALGVMYSDEITEMSEKPEEISPGDVVPPRAKSTTERVANKVRDSVHATGKHLKEWWTYDPNAKTREVVIPNSYCYRAQGDVLCYRAPMPGWEHRLIGYQGTFANAPPPAVMQPMPVKIVDESMLPVNRVANSNPVFSELPSEQKEEAPKDPSELLDVTPQNVQETIQDPSVSPQL